ncbi:MAG: penicillin-binding protein activator [Myxococcota bacterium]
MIGRMMIACLMVAAGCATARPDPTPVEGPPDASSLPPGPPADPHDTPREPTPSTPPTPLTPEPPPAAETLPDAVRRQFLAGAPDDALALAGGEAARAQVIGWVEPELTLERTRALNATVPAESSWAGWLARRELDLACASSAAAWQECRATLASPVRGRLVGAELEPLVKELDQRAAVWSAVAPRTVGVLLPLSGPHDKAGLAAREAIELAFGEHPEVKLVFEDTAEDPAQAAAKAEHLLTVDHVAALLGPIGRRETAAVATVARRYGVPHVVLASALDAAVAPAVPDPVLRVRTSAAELAAALAQHARGPLGVTRVAILQPDTDLGSEAAQAFAAEIVRLGGEVAASATYPANAGGKADDFKAALAALVRAPKPGKDATIDFDAIFIPDQAVVVRRLVPFLKAWGIVPKTQAGPLAVVKPRKGKPLVHRVQLLGSSGWGSPTVIERAEGLTDNAIFADVWAPELAAGATEASAFAAAFSLRFGRAPTAFHAEVFDAARFLAGPVAAVDGADQGARVAILGALLAAHTLPGATGVIAVSDGRVAPRVRLRTVDGETLRPRVSEDEERARRAQRPAPGEPTP